MVFDEARVSSIFISVLKPKLHRVDGNVASALAYVKYSAFAYKASVVAAVEVMFKAFKAESFLPLPPNAQSAAQAQHSTPPRGNGGKAGISGHADRGGGDENDQIIKLSWKF